MNSSELTFFDLGQIHIMISDDVVSQPNEALRNLFSTENSERRFAPQHHGAIRLGVAGGPVSHTF